MKIIYNKFIPFKGFYAINLFGVLFVRGTRVPSDHVINHESIHTAQMKELLYIFFYMLYFFEWVFKLIKYGDSVKAYKNISFEREAYSYEYDLDYLNTRKHFASFKYLSKEKVS